jgi:hypothetical protein
MEQEEKDSAVLYLHIISPIMVLINFIIEIFLVTSRSFQNIRLQYRVSTSTMQYQVSSTEVMMQNHRSIVSYTYLGHCNLCHKIH